MDKERFEVEKAYEASLSVARQMLESGVITEEDFERIREILIEKHAPLFGSVMTT